MKSNLHVQLRYFRHVFDAMRELTLNLHRFYRGMNRPSIRGDCRFLRLPLAPSCGLTKWAAESLQGLELRVLHGLIRIGHQPMCRSHQARDGQANR